MIKIFIIQLKTPEVSSELTVLAPGHMAPAGPSVDSTGDAKTKRKRRKSVDVSKSTICLVTCFNHLQIQLYYQ